MSDQNIYFSQQVSEMQALIKDLELRDAHYQLEAARLRDLSSENEGLKRKLQQGRQKRERMLKEKEALLVQTFQERFDQYE